MSTILSFLYRLYRTINPPQPPTNLTLKPIRFGILGAAQIAPPALIIPAKSHSEVEVYAIAARDEERAFAYGKKYGIPKVYAGKNGYQDLLDDPDVDAVYNPLPNSLHYEWTMKALAAGKHVLLEKPSADTAEETRMMFELAERNGLILLEAFHFRFHPAIQRVKAIIDRGELGTIKSVSAKLMFPKAIKETDIRYNYGLGGGALMDMGCYTINCIRYLSASDPLSILSATCEPFIPPSSAPDFIPKIDRRTTATLVLQNDIIATLDCDLGIPHYLGFIPHMPRLGVVVECEGGRVELNNYVLPTIYHSVNVCTRDGKSRVEKVYTFGDAGVDAKGEDWWMTHRYQLEAFVDRLKGRKPQTWVSADDSVKNMEWIEKIYEEIGLGSRPKSSYVPKSE